MAILKNQSLAISCETASKLFTAPLKVQKIFFNNRYIAFMETRECIKQNGMLKLGIRQLMISSWAPKNTPKIVFLSKNLQKNCKKSIFGQKMHFRQQIQVKSEYLNSTSLRYLKKFHKHRLNCKNVFKRYGFMLILMHV